MRLSSRSGASARCRSMALAAAGSADCRNTVNKACASLMHQAYAIAAADRSAALACGGPPAARRPTLRAPAIAIARAPRSKGARDLLPDRRNRYHAREHIRLEHGDHADDGRT